tara:strand:- start:14448 stop:14885 length:438 start_codon:yes stop_codon:yes gene_type:complete
MALRIGSRDRSTEDYGDNQPSYGFPSAQPGQWSSISPHSDITQAMATAAGWPGPGLGAAMPPTGINRPGQGAVPGAGWNPGVPHSGYPQSYNTGGYYANPMGYGAGGFWGADNTGGQVGLGGGGWGGGLWGGGDPEDSDNYGGSG